MDFNKRILNQRDKKVMDEHGTLYESICRKKDLHKPKRASNRSG